MAILLTLPDALALLMTRCYWLQTGRTSPAHRRCPAIPDQHTVNLIVSSSSSSLPALLHAQQEQALHHSAAAVQVIPCSINFPGSNPLAVKTFLALHPSIEALML